MNVAAALCGRPVSGAHRGASLRPKFRPEIEIPKSLDPEASSGPGSG